MSLVGTDVLRDVVLMRKDNAKFAIFFKTCMIFSEVNVNMAVKKLLIQYVYKNVVLQLITLEMIHLISKNVIGVRNENYN